MCFPTESGFMLQLEYVFADVLGLTRENWSDIEKIRAEMLSVRLFGGDAFKCTVAAFVIYFDQTGYLEDDRVSDAGLN